MAVPRRRLPGNPLKHEGNDQHPPGRWNILCLARRSPKLRRRHIVARDLNGCHRHLLSPDSGESEFNRFGNLRVSVNGRWYGWEKCRAFLCDHKVLAPVADLLDAHERRMGHYLFSPRGLSADDLADKEKVRTIDYGKIFRGMKSI